MLLFYFLSLFISCWDVYTQTSTSSLFSLQKVLVKLLPQQDGQVLPVSPSEESDVGSLLRVFCIDPSKGLSPQQDYSQPHNGKWTIVWVYLYPFPLILKRNQSELGLNALLQKFFIHLFIFLFLFFYLFIYLFIAIFYLYNFLSRPIYCACDFLFLHLILLSSISALF